MDIRANLQALLNKVDSDEKLRSYAIHNLHAYFSIQISIKLATDNALNFDMRRDLWHRPDRVLLVGYYAEYFRDAFAPIKEIRSHLFASKRALESAWESTLKSRHFKTGLDWEEHKKGDWRRFCEDMSKAIDTANFPAIAPEVLSRHPAFKGLRHAADRLTAWLDICATEDSPQNCNKGFRLRMAMVPYFIAQQESDLPRATLAVLAWDAIFTMTNSYQTGGQQVMAPVLGNEDCSRLLSFVKQWMTGKSIAEVPFTGLSSKGNERVDCSEWSTVTEVYGFTRLHQIPYINGVNLRTFQAIAGSAENAFASTAGEKIRQTLTRDRELTKRLQDTFRKLKEEVPQPQSRLASMESNSAKRLSDLYDPQDQLRNFADQAYRTAFTEFRPELSDVDEATILAHILFDCQAFSGRADSRPVADSSVGTNEQDSATDVDTIPSDDVSATPTSTAPLNTILCGPPGTGKTYQSIYRALEIIDGHSFQTESSEARRRKLAMQRFKDLRQHKRIAFVTFHQSYSYEDFVEGIRPVLDSETQQLHYEVKEGALRSLVTTISAQSAATRHRSIKSDAVVWRVSLGDDNHFRTCLDQGSIGLGYGINDDLSGIDLTSHFSHHGLTTGRSIIQMFRDEVAQGDIVCVFNSATSIKAIGVVTSDYYFDASATGYTQRRRVEWLDRRMHDIQHLNAGKRMMTPSLHRLAIPVDSLVALATETTTVHIDRRPYVLIIDEINRANISKVFGELITLIEPDKREGAPNHLSVRLPYSGVEFSLPQNLHIIGTMNTADRSIAVMDFALRRRFVFQYLAPDADQISEVVDGVPLRRIFTTLNQKIEDRLGRDYMIGHALLSGVRDLPTLKQVWCEQIVPLLGEYFFDEWRHLEAVIPGFVEKVDAPSAGYAGRQAMRLVTPSDDTFIDRIKKCA